MIVWWPFPNHGPDNGNAWSCELPGQLQETFGPFGPEVCRGVSPGVSPENGGCPTECPIGCLRRPSRPGSGVSKKCPESVPGASRSVPDSPGTLSGHFLDTPEPRARRAPKTSHRTLRRTLPVFGDTPRDTPHDTSGSKRPIGSCSWPGSSQEWRIHVVPN